MEKIYGYSRWYEQKTRHSLENLDEVLKDFFVKYTDTSLKKIILHYSPLRPGEASYPDKLLETDNEIDSALEHIEKMNVISKERHPDHRYRRYKYELPISHYGDVLNFIKGRGGMHSYVQMFVHQRFNFKHYDYTEILTLLKNHEEHSGNMMALCLSELDYVNELALHINNDIYNANKCTHRIGFTLLFPEHPEQSRELLQEIEKVLKIRFLPRNFFYYYIHYFKNGEGKIKYKREKITF